MRKYNLKTARGSVGLTQEEAAKRIGVSESTIYLWEKGKRKPNSKYIPKILETYNLGIADIIF